MEAPQLKKRLDTPYTAMKAFAHAILMCKDLFDHTPIELVSWFTQSFDNGVGNSEMDYYVRFDFEFYRATSFRKKVSVLMHYAYYIFGLDAEPCFMEAEFFVNDILVATRTQVDILEERPDEIRYIDPELLASASLQILARARYIQVFEWKSASSGTQLAKLVVYHRRTMLMIDVPMHDSVEKVRAELMELVEVGLNFQEVVENVPEGYVRFVAQRGHNWNNVSRDFITTIDRLLGTKAEEIL